MTCFFEYKCRRCGGIDRNGIAGAEKIAIAALTECLTLGRCTRFGIPIMMFTTHLCNDHGYGVSDLIGVRREIESEPHNAGSGSSGSPITRDDSQSGPT